MVCFREDWANLENTVILVGSQGCARFLEFVQNFSERQIFGTLCSVDFHTFTLQLPIQTLHSVAPELQVFVSSLENCQNFSIMSTPLVPLFVLLLTSVPWFHGNAGYL